jgi:putative membrane protein
MIGTDLFALTVHVIGFTFWVGGLFVLSLFMSAAGEEPMARRIGAIARRVAVVTDAAAGLTIAAGIGLLSTRAWVLAQPWMHIKLTFLVGLLAVHGIVRVRAKKLANGGPPPSAAASIAVAALAIAIIAVVLLKPMAR